MRLIEANVALQRFIEETETSGKNVIHINTIKRLLWDMDASCYREIYTQGYNQGTIDRAEEVTKAREQGYAKGIDDFYDNVLNFEDYIEPLDTSEFGAVLLYSGKDITNMIVKIAEEMRGAE